MRRIALLAAFALLPALLQVRQQAAVVLAQASEIVVTSASDAAGTDAECPSDPRAIMPAPCSDSTIATSATQHRTTRQLTFDKADTRMRQVC